MHGYFVLIDTTWYS